MIEVDRLLEDAGARWRATQLPHASIDPGLLVDGGWSVGRWPLVAVAGTAGLAIALGGIALQGPPPPQAGGPPASSAASPTPAGTAVPSASASPSPVAGRAGDCEITKPDRPFVPPPPYPTTAPELYEAEWFGTAELFTMLDRDGETWRGLPRTESGYGQKTFWWSTRWKPDVEPEPRIEIDGVQLDGAGTLSSGPGTNASREDFGTAMLVGVAVPNRGCWQLTGRYEGAELSYVVWVEGD